MNKRIRLGLAQINCTVGDLEGNAEKIISCVGKAKREGVDIVSFPEMAVTGYPPEDLLLKPKFIEDNRKILDRIASECRDITAVVGFADSNESGIFNAAAIIHNGKTVEVYHKILLPNYGVFDEKRYFMAGSRCPVFRLGDIIFGVNICEDVWHSDGPTKVQAAGGADIIININASPFHAGKHRERERILADRVSESGVTIAYTNLVGGQDELVFDGGSMIMNSGGELLARAPQFEEELLVADVDIGGITRSTPSLYPSGHKPCQGGGGDEKPELYMLDGGLKEKKTPVRGDVAAPLGPIEEVYNALVLGTRDYVRKSGFRNVIIGLSGGIDSALTAAVAVDALGPENVMGIAMPSRYSSEGSINDARELAGNLGIGFHVISIEDIFGSFNGTLGPMFEGYEEDVTEENIQARIRGNILMALSNKFGRMLLTTGNKSEVSVGYATLYGDMAGGFSVLKDVPKTAVYRLAQFRNGKEDRMVIPRSTMTKPPSAELRPDQTDQDSLPPYDMLDAILQRYIEDELSLDEIVSNGFDPYVVGNIISMVDRNEYKRRQAAPGVKITPRAFGRDRRMPIVNRYRGLKGD